MASSRFSPPGGLDALHDPIEGRSPIEPVAVERISMFLDLAATTPVAERVRGYPQILGGLLDRHVVAKIRHDRVYLDKA